MISESFAIGIIAIFLIIISIWTYHLYTVTGDKRKLMFSLSILIGSIGYRGGTE